MLQLQGMIFTLLDESCWDIHTLLQQPSEPPLQPARLHSIDGCNSFKRLDGSGHTDDRKFSSPYLIPRSKVNEFSDDVQTQSSSSQSDTTLLPDDFVPCTDNWAAAHAISEETTKVFEQTGIFLTACRHGIVESIIEMIRSGEL